MTEVAEKAHCPTMSGTTTAYKPQWRNSKEWGAAINERMGFKGGQDWTNVPVTIVRGGVVLQTPDGRELMTGVPFPRWPAGVLETIYLYGYEQAQALAWWYAAGAQSVGATIEVRVQHYELKYDIKAREIEAAEHQCAAHDERSK